jgi:hypothetical protein
MVGDYIKQIPSIQIQLPAGSSLKCLTINLHV